MASHARYLLSECAKVTLDNEEETKGRARPVGLMSDTVKESDRNLLNS